MPERTAALGLRAVTGNLSLDEVGQGINRALRRDEIAALAARGD